MLRLLIAAWGDEASEWVGRRVTLYRDESVRFGSDAVGGIRVSHMSNLPDGKPFETRLTSSRGKRTKVRVEPLRDAPKPEPLTDAMIACCDDQEQLKTWWHAHPEQRPAIQQRKAELDGGAA